MTVLLLLFQILFLLFPFLKNLNFRWLGLHTMQDGGSDPLTFNFNNYIFYFYKF